MNNKTQNENLDPQLEDNKIDDVDKVSSISLIKNGFNYHFTVAQYDIHAWGSTMSGREKIFVDGQLVSNKLSFTKKSVHSFVLDNMNYEVEFKMVNLLTGELHCMLIKDGVHVETQKQVAKFYANKKVTKTRLALLTLASGVFGYWSMSFLLERTAN